MVVCATIASPHYIQKPHEQRQSSVAATSYPSLPIKSDSLYSSYAHPPKWSPSPCNFHDWYLSVHFKKISPSISASSPKTYIWALSTAYSPFLSSFISSSIHPIVSPTILSAENEEFIPCLLSKLAQLPS